MVRPRPRPPRPLTQRNARLYSTNYLTGRLTSLLPGKAPQRHVHVRGQVLESGHRGVGHGRVIAELFGGVVQPTDDEEDMTWCGRLSSLSPRDGNFTRMGEPGSRRLCRNIRRFFSSSFCRELDGGEGCRIIATDWCVCSSAGPRSMLGVLSAWLSMFQLG